MIYTQKVLITFEKEIAHIRAINPTITLTDDLIKEKIIRFINSEMFCELDKANALYLTNYDLDSTVRSGIKILGSCHLLDFSTYTIKIKILPTDNSIDFSRGTVLLTHSAWFNDFNDFSRLYEYRFVYLPPT